MLGLPQREAAFARGDDNSGGSAHGGVGTPVGGVVVLVLVRWWGSGVRSIERDEEF
jgi:hypothetical protein